MAKEQENVRASERNRPAGVRANVRAREHFIMLCWAAADAVCVCVGMHWLLACCCICVCVGTSMLSHFVRGKRDCHSGTKAVKPN